MSVERLSRSEVAGESEEAVTRFIESDFKVRSGLCPNNCGLMAPCDYGQECPTCHFSTNKLEDDVAQAMREVGRRVGH